MDGSSARSMSAGGGMSDRSDRLPQLRGSPERHPPRSAGGNAGSSSPFRGGLGEHASPESPSAAYDGGVFGHDGSGEANPFSLPREDVFLMREREKAAKAQERERLTKMKIWEKPARSSQLLSSTQQVLASSYADRVAERQKYLSTTLNTAGALASRALHSGVGPAAMAPSAGQGLGSTAPGSANGASGGAGGVFHVRRREKENMSDFIAKKRDMFLIQMSLDTKRAEIQKLEEKAQMKEDALRKSEQMLEEDAMRFDAFLKENDRKAHDALKRADLETKEKQEKVLEIKKLNAEISKVENEMSKYEEQLLACMKYKEFLDSLTPQEHKDKVAKRKAERAKARAARAAAGGSAASARRSSASSAGDEKENGASSASAAAAGVSAAAAAASGGGDSDSDDDDAMYFERPEQLLEIFAQLEERNLFLIQNVQETEEALDELHNKFQETKAQMEEKTQGLHASIADLRAKIRHENEKAAALRRRASASSVAGTQQKLLAGLSEKVAQVYSACGLDPDTQTDTLDMLRDIEQWLETLLASIQTMDTAKVEAAEKKKNAERREQIRAIKREEQQRLYEERLAKSAARANAEVVRRVGKPIMFRSPPLRKKKKKENVAVVDEEAEELKRFFT